MALIVIDYIFARSTVEKLLLVADPQLIGEKDEGFFGWITRKDADRYDDSVAYSLFSILYSQKLSLQVTLYNTDK